MLVDIDDDVADRLIASADPVLREIGFRFYEAKGARPRFGGVGPFARVRQRVAEGLSVLRDHAIERLESRATSPGPQTTSRPALAAPAGAAYEAGAARSRAG